MKGRANVRSSIFLLTASGVGLVVFALPLLLSPLRWAKALRWRVPADSDLALYLGRSLGALAVTLTLGGIRAAFDPWRNRILFPMAAVAASLLTLVHIVGAVQRRQPWTETAEIVFWGAMTVGAAACHPKPPEEESVSSGGQSLGRRPSD
jgi:hypothetical protein